MNLPPALSELLEKISHFCHSLSLQQLTVLDVAVAIIFLFFLIRGAWIGFVRQLAAFAGLLVSYWVAGRYASALLPFFADYIASPKVAFFLAFGLLFLFMTFLFVLAGVGLEKIMKISMLGWFDQLLGLLLGAVKAYFLASILFMALGAILPPDSELLKRSQCTPYLKEGAALVQKVVNDPELRKFLEQPQAAATTQAPDQTTPHFAPPSDLPPRPASPAEGGRRPGPPGPPPRR